MYPVSESFLRAVNSPTRDTRITGVITLPDLSKIIITDEIIKAGSLNITNAIVSDDNIKVGSVYMGQLQIGIYTDVSRYSLYGAVISLNYEIFTDAEEYESIPLGFYVVQEANRNGGYVSITAYDNMVNLTKELSYSSSDKFTPYQYLEMISDNTSVELSQTEEEINAISPVDIMGEIATYGVAEQNDIKNYRDVLYYVTQLLGGFATIDNQGKLKIKRYSKTPNITVSDDLRISSEFSDYVCNYTGFSMNVDGDFTNEQKIENTKAQINYLTEQRAMLQSEFNKTMDDLRTEYNTDLKREYERHSNRIAEIAEMPISESDKRKLEDKENKLHEANISRIKSTYKSDVNSVKNVYEHNSREIYKQITSLESLLSSTQVSAVLFVGNTDGLAVSVDNNPFLYYNSFEDKETIIDQIGDNFIGLTYNPARFNILENPAIELGDMIENIGFTAGNGVNSSVQKITFKYGAGMEIECVGKNALLADISSAASSSDRATNTAAVLAKDAAVRLVVVKNDQITDVGEIETQILKGEVRVTSITSLQLNGQIILNVTNPGTVQIEYEVNEIRQDFKPKQICSTGYHTITLFKALEKLEPSVITYVNVYIKGLDGLTGSVASNDSEMVISGSSIIQTEDKEWDGTIVVSDNYNKFTIQGVQHKENNDNSEIKLWQFDETVDEAVTVSDDYNKFTIKGIQHKENNDNPGIELLDNTD